MVNIKYIPINQSDLRDKFTVYVKSRFTARVRCFYISVIQLSLPSFFRDVFQKRDLIKKEKTVFETHCPCTELSLFNYAKINSISHRAPLISF